MTYVDDVIITYTERLLLVSGKININIEEVHDENYYHRLDVKE